MKNLRQRGSALLIVLAFVVILSTILLAYVSRTEQAMRTSSSSAAIMGTELLAETAEDTIISDLRQEMLAGSDGAQLPAVGQPMLVSQPWAMVPGRVIRDTISQTDPNYFNLVKQSVNGEPFYPGDSPASYTAKGTVAKAAGNARASSVNTSTASLNGRLISAARWNKPALLGGNGLSADQLPDWILISRNGAATDGSAAGKIQEKNPANKEFVIGRYAYNIYDVGGLLDVNVAGFDSSDTAANSAAAWKGSSAWADLASIPGIIDEQKLVAWRNKLSKSDYAAMVRGRPGDIPNREVTWGEAGGFQRPFHDGEASDNRLFTRQDLLKYQERFPDALSRDALPFLTTFSADLDQPSFAPDAGRPKIKSGRNNSYNYDDSINPNLRSVLGPDGEPVLKRRFPLDRLKYVVPNPPPGTADAIRNYFGLHWNGQYWEYDVDGNEIKWLSQLNGREPNFVELLKAAISAGTLGGQYQGDEYPLSNRKLSDQEYGVVNRHIIQIAANIIDQFDTDNYPTRIAFAGQVYSGKEDLPYIYLIRNAAYRRELVDENDFTPISARPPAGMGMPYRYVVLIQPTLWNPHAAGSPDGADGPTEFRISAYSPQVRVVPYNGWWSGAQNRDITTYPSKNGLDNTLPVQFLPGSHYITFNTTPDPNSKASFREPYTLKFPNFPPGSNAFSPTIEPTISPVERNNPADPEDCNPASTAIGFKVGYVWGGPSTGNNAEYLQHCKVLSADGVTFTLEYKDRFGNYIPYDELRGCQTGNDINHDLPDGFRDMRFAVRLDPRTTRYSLRAGNAYIPDKIDSSKSRRWWLQGWSAWPGPDYGISDGATVSNGHYASAGESANAGWSGSQYFPQVSENKPTSVVRYEDPDGVRRLAMGGYSSGWIGRPMQTTASAGTSDNRPIILNRPFESVAELGYAFRDQPWKQLDFFTPESGDLALLDVFCVEEPSDPDAKPLVAGRVNLNTRHPEVLEALLRGTAKNPTGAKLSDAAAESVAKAIVNWTRTTGSGNGPFRNRAELVGRWVSGTNYAGVTTNLATALGGPEGHIQISRQSVMRALVDGGTTGTWSFLIDLIVQEGRYPENAAVGQFGKFLVKGESRYWIHLSMDRFTGEVISKVVEAVND